MLLLFGTFFIEVCQVHNFVIGKLLKSEVKIDYTFCYRYKG